MALNNSAHIVTIIYDSEAVGLSKSSTSKQHSLSLQKVKVLPYNTTVPNLKIKHHDEFHFSTDTAIAAIKISCELKKKKKKNFSLHPSFVL